MRKDTKRKPKKGDILVLSTARNCIYEYNPKGKSYNSYVVAAQFFSNGHVTVSYKFSDLDVVGYNADWDYATPEEIEKFNQAIKDNKIKCKKSYACEIAEKITDYYTYYDKDSENECYNKLVSDLSKDLFELINKYFPTN